MEGGEGGGGQRETTERRAGREAEGAWSLKVRLSVRLAAPRLALFHCKYVHEGHEKYAPRERAEGGGTHVLLALVILPLATHSIRHGAPRAGVHGVEGLT